MSPKQAENEVKEKSIAEKARMTVSDVQDEVVETSNAEEVSGDAVNEAVEEDTTKENSDPLAEIYGDTEIRLDFKVDITCSFLSHIHCIILHQILHQFLM